MKTVFPSYFIIYVGFAINGMAAPVFNQKKIGQYSFYFSFICLVILFVLMIYRYLKYRDIAEPLKPLFCIFAAPINLCLASYLQSFEQKNIGLVIAMLALGLVVYLIVVCSLVTVMKPTFYPSYAAFTFPFVISAIATKGATGFLANAGYSVIFLKYIFGFQASLATILTLYALIRFINHAVKSKI